MFNARIATPKASSARPRIGTASSSPAIARCARRPISTHRTDAAEFFKKRISDALGGKIVLSRNVTYDDLRDLIITDYTNNGRKSLGDLKSTRLPRLDAVFGDTKAVDITTTVDVES